MKTVTQHGKIALKFANALVEHRFDDAHALLSRALRDEYPPAVLRENYENMIAYGGNPPSSVELVHDEEDYFNDDLSQVGWSYVAICGPFAEPRLKGGYWSEAVAVTVIHEQGVKVVNEITWKRP